MVGAQELLEPCWPRVAQGCANQLWMPVLPLVPAALINQRKFPEIVQEGVDLYVVQFKFLAIAFQAMQRYCQPCG